VVAVEGGHPAARKGARPFNGSWGDPRARVRVPFVPPGWKPGSTAGQEACRHLATSNRTDPKPQTGVTQILIGSWW